MELFADTSFEDGFTVTGKTTDLPNIGKIVPPNKDDCDPAWRISQWSCDNNFLDGKIERLSEKSYRVSTASQVVTVDGSAITLELKASAEYGSRRRIPMQSWPHLLLEQAIPDDRSPKMSVIGKLRLCFGARLLYSEAKMENPDPNLHTGQISMYFTLCDRSDGDYIWFGIPIYDARRAMVLLPSYMAQDGGKASTNKFIYVPEQSNFVDKPAGSGEWLTYDLDMMPYLREAYKTARERGYVQGCDFDKMTFTSMNCGWEMPGTYDCAVTVRDLSLDAVLI